MDNFLEEIGLIKRIKQYSPRYFAQEIFDEEAILAAKILVKNLVAENINEQSMQLALSTLRVEGNA